MKPDEQIRAEERKEPVYQLKISGPERYAMLTAKVYASNGSEIEEGRYPITDFTYLGSQQVIWRDERGYFDKEDLYKLIKEIEKHEAVMDTSGKPFFINGFLLTRRTGKTRVETFPVEVSGGTVNSWETYYESPVEFFQVEVDLEHRLDIPTPRTGTKKEQYQKLINLFEKTLEEEIVSLSEYQSSWTGRDVSNFIGYQITRETSEGSLVVNLYNPRYTDDGCNPKRFMLTASIDSREIIDALIENEGSVGPLQNLYNSIGLKRINGREDKRARKFEEVIAEVEAKNK